MKKLFVFSLLMLFLVGVVSAIDLSITTPMPVIILENGVATINLETDGNATFDDNVTDSRMNLNVLDETHAVFTFTPGFDSINLDMVYFIQFEAANALNSSETDTEIASIWVTNVNRAPTADAGANQNVGVNGTITLDGSASSDPDSDDLTYSWVKTSGPSVTLSDATAQSPTFELTGNGTYVFELTVNDGTVNSNVDTVTITAAETINLAFKDLDIKVGSKTDSNLQDRADGYEIDRNAEPGDKIEFTIEIENTYEIDMDIEDVVVTITIEDIDDGDELEEETDGENIKDGKDETFKLDFEVPMKVDEGNYDVIIEVVGEDEDGKEHKISKNFVLVVDKEKHNVIIDNAVLKSEILSCKSTTSLDIDILNLGSDSEEEVRIVVQNSELNLDFEEYDDGDIELETGIDDDAEYSLSVPINADGVAPGDYPIDIRVYRDETKLEDSMSVTLTVEECKSGTPPVDDEEEEEEEDVDVDVVVKPADTTPATTTTGTQIPVIAQVKEDSFLESGIYVTLLVLAAVVLVGLIIWIIVLLGKK